MIIQKLQKVNKQPKCSGHYKTMLVTTVTYSFFYPCFKLLLLEFLEHKQNKNNDGTDIDIIHLSFLGCWVCSILLILQTLGKSL